MAKKKSSKKNKEEVETVEIVFNMDKLASRNDSFVGDFARFLEDRIEEIRIERDGNNLVLTFPKSYSRRNIRSFVKKFLYTNGLWNDFRVIALQDEDVGYKIYPRKQLE
ncbi:MAG: hypothetical protein ACTSRZ_17615 [Promethearchaeota archaeon]